MEPVFFESPAAFRDWLAENHERAGELLVGLYKRGAGQTGISYRQALDQALAYGWIDGVTHRIDAERYAIRFTPRKPGSIWSAVNTKRVEELIAAGLMEPPGLAAFERRDPGRTAAYSYEVRSRGLDLVYDQTLQANDAAWAFFQAQPPSYRRAASWWVMSAKREETRQRRLSALVADSAQGRRLTAVTYRPKG